MGEVTRHSLILVCDFRVDDVDGMWHWMQDHKAELAKMGAHHAVVYTSIWEPNRVLVTLGVRHPDSIRDLLRSSGIFEWFDATGVEDIPPIFGGEIVEKIDVSEPAPPSAVAGVIVGAIASIPNVPALMVKVHGALDRFRYAGVRKIWVYQAVDDGNEVLILQEIDNEADAREWVAHPDAAAEWMSRAGLGVYPALFVGKFAHLMSVEQGQAGAI